VGGLPSGKGSLQVAAVKFSTLLTGAEATMTTAKGGERASTLEPETSSHRHLH
jgi:hypothetical protein